mmetsp:Transcript_53484/g.100310  ORF Transcript_53484/g.100310 Transcript_53484/m.100310 type:complete len:82 (-) Transcript_53484:8-253(-)
MRFRADRNVGERACGEEGRKAAAGLCARRSSANPWLFDGLLKLCVGCAFPVETRQIKKRPSLRMTDKVGKQHEYQDCVQQT